MQDQPRRLVLMRKLLGKQLLLDIIEQVLVVLTRQDNCKWFRNCAGNTMNITIVEGKIVVCDNDYGNQAIQWKSEEVKRLGGIGVIVVDDKTMDLSYIDPSFLVTIVKPVDGLKIISYIKSTR